MSSNVGFLLSDVSRLLRRRFDERARSLGVTRSQWRVLTAVSRHEGIKQGALAELIEVEPITVCRMIDRLEAAGHVERRPDLTDRRAWRIYLAEKSRPLLEQLHGLGDGVIALALQHVSESDRMVLAACLDRLRENLADRPDEERLAHG